MGNFQNYFFDSLGRSIISEGLEVLCSGRDFAEWASMYKHNEEVILPGEIEFVEKFRDYVLLRGLSKDIPNPRYDLSFVEKVCSDLG